MECNNIYTQITLNYILYFKYILNTIPLSSLESYYVIFPLRLHLLLLPLYLSLPLLTLSPSTSLLTSPFPSPFPIHLPSPSTSSYPSPSPTHSTLQSLHLLPILSLYSPFLTSPSTSPSPFTSLCPSNLFIAVAEEGIGCIAADDGRERFMAAGE